MASQKVSPNEYILNLVNDALNDIESIDIPLSSVIRKCIRIALLRNDYINQLWLELELKTLSDKSQKDNTVAKIASHLARNELAAFASDFIHSWNNERRYFPLDENLKPESSERVLSLGVGEIEIEIRKLRKIASESVPPQGLHTLDMYFVSQEKDKIRTFANVLSSSYEAVLERIRLRVHNFLVETEKQLLFGQINADIFENNRRYVDSRLAKLSPEAVSQFISVYRRVLEKDPESYAQAALSCRRIIKTLADILYPPSEKPIKCADNKERILSDDKYINRLYQYVCEQIAPTSPRELLLAEIEYLDNKIKKLYDLTCKGAHAGISEFEINQCVIQTYLLVGDILRIADNQSAIIIGAQN